MNKFCGCSDADCFRALIRCRIFLDRLTSPIAGLNNVQKPKKIQYLFRFILMTTCKQIKHTNLRRADYDNNLMLCTDQIWDIFNTDFIRFMIRAFMVSEQ